MSKETDILEARHALTTKQIEPERVLVDVLGIPENAVTALNLRGVHFIHQLYEELAEDRCKDSGVDIEILNTDLKSLGLPQLPYSAAGVEEFERAASAHRAVVAEQKQKEVDAKAPHPFRDRLREIYPVFSESNDKYGLEEAMYTIPDNLDLTNEAELTVLCALAMLAGDHGGWLSVEDVATNYHPEAQAFEPFRLMFRAGQFEVERKAIEWVRKRFGDDAADDMEDEDIVFS